jgi:hypothetical protein
VEKLSASEKDQLYQRKGHWTTAEMRYADAIIQQFIAGKLHADVSETLPPRRRRCFLTP